MSGAQDIYSIFSAMKETKRFFVWASETRTVLRIGDCSSVKDQTIYFSFSSWVAFYLALKVKCIT